MGKRKVKHDHPKHVQEQCDVWLTAKLPPKQQVLRRLPLTVIQRVYPEPTFDVPIATKQTTLLDFFKKPRKSEREDSLLNEQQAEENHKPANLKRGFSWDRLNDDQVVNLDTPQDDVMDAKPPTKQMRKSNYSEPTTRGLIDTSGSLQQQEDKLLGRKTTKQGNHSYTLVSGTSYQEQSATNHDSDISTPRSRTIRSSIFETPSQSTHLSPQRSSDHLESQKCQGTDQEIDSSVYDYSSDSESLHSSPYPDSSLSTDNQSCKVTFVPLKEVTHLTSSHEDIETEEVSASAFQNSSGPCKRYKEFPQASRSLKTGESSMPPAATKSRRFQYINPNLLDTETSQTQLADGVGAGKARLTDTYPKLNGRVLRVNIVDSDLMLNTCSIGESTEGSQWSRPDLSVDDLTLSMNSPSSLPMPDPFHHPADFSEFRLNTQGCFVPNEPANETSLDEEDSQAYE